MAKEKKTLVAEDESPLDKLIKDAFNNSGSAVNMAEIDTKVKLWFDTGVYAFNYNCSKNLKGGIPAGRITSLEGLSSTGKSLFMASIMKDPQIDKIFLIESEGGGASAELLDFVGVDLKKVTLFKASTLSNYRINKETSKIEGVADKDMPKKLDTDTYRYFEGATRIIKRIIDMVEYNKITARILIVLDSIANLQPLRELQGISSMGSNGVEIGNLFRSFDNAFERTNIAFLFTNKLYTNIGNEYDPWKSSGGVNVEYNPSLTVRLSTTSETDDVTASGIDAEKASKKTGMGSSLKTIRATSKKSRFGTEARNVYFMIDFSTGPVRYSGLFTLLKDFGIITQTGSRYSLPVEGFESFFKKDFISKCISYGETVIDKFQELLNKKELETKELKLKFQANDMEEAKEVEEEIGLGAEDDAQELRNAIARDMGV